MVIVKLHSLPLLLGFLLILSISGGVLFYFVRSQTLGFRNTKIVFVNESIDGQEMLINLAFISENGEEVTIYSFDPSLKTPVGSLGEYRLGAVYPLLKQEKYTNSQHHSFYAFIFQGIIDDVIPLDIKALETTQNLEEALWTSSNWTM